MHVPAFCVFFDQIRSVYTNILGHTHWLMVQFNGAQRIWWSSGFCRMGSYAWRLIPILWPALESLMGFYNYTSCEIVSQQNIIQCGYISNMFDKLSLEMFVFKHCKHVFSIFYFEKQNHKFQKRLLFPATGNIKHFTNFKHFCFFSIPLKVSKLFA